MHTWMTTKIFIEIRTSVIFYYLLSSYFFLNFDFVIEFQTSNYFLSFIIKNKFYYV